MSADAPTEYPETASREDQEILRACLECPEDLQAIGILSALLRTEMERRTDPGE